MSKIYRTCYTCDHKIECDDSPLLASWDHRTIIEPKFNAPMICKTCRPDPAKFQLARKAMLRFFGWEDRKSTGVPMRELNEPFPRIGR